MSFVLKGFGMRLFIGEIDSVHECLQGGMDDSNDFLLSKDVQTFRHTEGCLRACRR